MIPRMVQETWRPVAVPDFEDLYEVSDHGHVRRGPQGRILKSGVHPKGYHGVVLSGRGKRKSLLIHKIVLDTFVGPRPEGLEARHLDGDPTNNRLSNLAWGTSSENELDKRRHGTMQRGERNGSVKLTESQVLEIVRRHANGESQRALAVAFEVSQPQVFRIVSGQRWSHLTGITGSS